MVSGVLIAYLIDFYFGLVGLWLCVLITFVLIIASVCEWVWVWVC